MPSLEREYVYLRGKGGFFKKKIGKGRNKRKRRGKKIQSILRISTRDRIKEIRHSEKSCVKKSYLSIPERANFDPTDQPLRRGWWGRKGVLRMKMVSTSVKSPITGEGAKSGGGGEIATTTV